MSNINSVDKFFKKYPIKRFRQKEIVKRSDEDFKYVYFLKKGYVKMYSVSVDGDELSLNIFKPGSYFPILWAMGELANEYNYEAITSVEIRLVPKKEFIGFIKKNPAILFDLTCRLTVGFGSLLRRMEVLFFGSARNRVASALVIAAKRFGKENGGGEIRIAVPFTHKDIAALAGLTRETTSLEMKKFCEEGVIACRGRKNIVVVDMSKLVRLANYC